MTEIDTTMTMAAEGIVKVCGPVCCHGFQKLLNDNLLGDIWLLPQQLAQNSALGNVAIPFEGVLTSI